MNILFNIKSKYGSIKKVCKETGWDKKKALKEMNKARKNGLSFYRYANNNGWELSDDEIKDLAITLNNKKKQREICIKTVQNETEWDIKTVNKKMLAAKNLGISYFRYTHCHCWELSDSELKEFAQAYKKRKEQIKNTKEFCIDILEKKTLWPRKQCIAELEKAKNIGLSYIKYMQKGYYKTSKPKSNIKKQPNLDKEEKNTITNKKDEYMQAIRNNTGWSYGKTELEVLKAKVNCECSYEDYCLFKLYEVSPEEQKKYVTLGLFEKMRIKYNDPHEAVHFGNKSHFNTIFSDLINRKWFINKDISYEEFIDKIVGLDTLIVKPIYATQGSGVYKISCNVSEEDNKLLYQKLMQSQLSIIEECIIQHDEINKICSTSVNTVRVTTIYFENKCHYLYSVFRMGQGAVVDNFHAGGIAASVDVKTGKVITNATDLEGNIYPIHPISKIKIKGLQIPHWDKILDICEKATGRVKDVNLVGWDFAITPDGVELIEGNSEASYVVAQIPNIEDRVGLRSVMVDPYL